MNGLALYKDLSGVRKMRAAEHFDKGAFAGAIFTDEAQDFTSVQFHGDIFQGLDAGEGFINLAHFQKEHFVLFLLLCHTKHHIKALFCQGTPTVRYLWECIAKRAFLSSHERTFPLYYQGILSHTR